MTEYSTLWNADTSTHHVIAKEDYEDDWYVYLTAHNAESVRDIAYALTLKEARLD